MNFLSGKNKATPFTKAILYKIWIFVALCIVIYKGVIPGWEDRPSDFYNYYVSAKLVSIGEPINKFYDNDWFRLQAQNMGIQEGAKFSPFPPVTAYAYMPLVVFEPLTAKRIWIAFHILLLIALSFRIRKITNWSFTQALLFISLFTLPITSCINLGQLYLLIGFVLLELLGPVSLGNKPKLTGFVIGLLASLKYLPILFLAYLLKHPKRNTLLICSFLGIAIPFLIVFLLDHQAYNAFFQHFSSHLNGNLPGQGKYAIAFQSIDSMLNNLFVFDAQYNPSPYINNAILKPIIKYSLFFLIGGMLFFAFKRNNYKLSAVLVSISILAAFVLIPASTSYHFVLLLWPLLQLINWMVSYTLNQELIILGILIFLTFTVQQYQIRIFDQFPTFNLLIHYPRFWGILCVFLFSYFCHLKVHNKIHG